VFDIAEFDLQRLIFKKLRLTEVTEIQPKFLVQPLQVQVSVKLASISRVQIIEAEQDFIRVLEAGREA